VEGGLRQGGYGEHVGGLLTDHEVGAFAGQRQVARSTSGIRPARTPSWRERESRTASTVKNGCGIAASIPSPIAVSWSRKRLRAETGTKSSRYIDRGAWCEAIERQEVSPVAGIL
jgi:hypothetical protein